MTKRSHAIFGQNEGNYDYSLKISVLQAIDILLEVHQNAYYYTVLFDSAIRKVYYNYRAVTLSVRMEGL